MTLVERLQEWHRFAAEQMSRDWDEQEELITLFRIAFRDGADAADEITRLTAENERLREAMEHIKDEAALFVLEKLCKALGLADYLVLDGSGTWEGDVTATLMQILRDAKVIPE